MSAFGIAVDEKSVRVLNHASKQEALDQLVEAAAAVGSVTDVEALRTAIHDREHAMSTGIGGGVAVPHVRINAVAAPTLAVGISREGIEFESPDRQPVKLVLLFAMPKDTNRQYLGLLAQTMTALKNTNFYERLVGAASPRDVLAVLNSVGA